MNNKVVPKVYMYKYTASTVAKAYYRQTQIYKQNIHMKQLAITTPTTTQHNAAQCKQCRTDPVACTGTGGETHVTPARSEPLGLWGAGLPGGGGLPCAPSVACRGEQLPQGVACQGDAAYPPRTGRRTWPGWVALGVGPWQVVGLI